MPKSENTVSLQSSSEKKRVQDIYILDVSGSMGGDKYVSAVAGIRKCITDNIKNPDVEMITTVCTFNYPTNIQYPILKEKTTEKLLGVEFAKPNGMTALLDAIGRTIEMFKDSKDAVLIKIFTDGAENNSRSFTPFAIKNLINECKSKGWTITFVGTEQDVLDIINRFGIDKSNTLSHDNTAQGIEVAYEVTRSAIANYSKSLSEGKNVTMSFFSQD